VSQSASLQDLWEENEQSWSGRVRLIIVNFTSTASSVDDINDVTDLPVLQDDSDADMAERFGASSKYFYVIDAEGSPRRVWYYLDYDDERDRLLGEVSTLLKEAG